MRRRQITAERLVEYRGPKAGKYLRREVNQQFHSLYEKVTLLRLLDPDFEQELQDLGAIDFLESFAKTLNQERRRASEAFRESTVVNEVAAEVEEEEEGIY